MFLYRIKSTDEGTFGILAHEGNWWYSLELPDRENRRNISRIPSGSYDVSLRYSPHFKKKLYHVKRVPNRSFILIHGANFAGDTKKGWQTHLHGCIALGKQVVEFRNKYGKMQKGIGSSGLAVAEMTRYLEGEPFRLTIKDL